MCPRWSYLSVTGSDVSCRQAVYLSITIACVLDRGASGNHGERGRARPVASAGSNRVGERSAIIKQDANSRPTANRYSRLPGVSLTLLLERFYRSDRRNCRTATVENRACLPHDADVTGPESCSDKLRGCTDTCIYIFSRVAYRWYRRGEIAVAVPPRLQATCTLAAFSSRFARILSSRRGERRRLAASPDVGRA